MVIFCSFSSALSDIPAKKRKDDEFVLETLRNNPRFSCFEASEHLQLAKTLDRLKVSGRIVYLDSVFPWCKVMVLQPKPSTASNSNEQKEG